MNNTQTQLELNKYHLDGNLLYKEHKYKEAITMWLLALDHYKDNYLHKNIYSNLANVYLILGEYDNVIKCCDKGLLINNYTELDKKLNNKMNIRRNIARTEISIINNSKIKLSENTPSIISTNILDLFNKNKYCHIPINSYYTSTNNRFVGVINVLTCISMFVVSKERQFVCHLPVSNLWHIDSLFEICKRELCEYKWDKIIFVGGHQSTNLFAEKIKFADTLIQICKTILPNTEIDTTKLNIYKGIKNIKSIDDEMNLRKNNTRFVLAVYDCLHKVIITHTDYNSENIIFNKIKEIVECEKNQYRTINLINGEIIKERHLVN